MQAAVGGIRHPDFFFIRSQADAVTRAAMSFGLAFAEALHFDSVKHLAAGQVADLKSQQIVHVHKTKRLRPIDREWPDELAEGTDLANHLVRSRVGHAQERRLQASKISVLAVQTDDRVVRPRVEDDFFYHLSRRSIQDVPMTLLE